MLTSDPKILFSIECQHSTRLCHQSSWMDSVETVLCLPTAVVTCPVCYPWGINCPECKVQSATLFVEQLRPATCATASMRAHLCVYVMDGDRQSSGFTHAPTDGLCRPETNQPSISQAVYI